jgi:Uma2 family endonuclease
VSHLTSHTRDTGLPNEVQPEVVFEIRSRDQPVADLRKKCLAYLDNIVAILIDPQGQCYWVYTTDDLEPAERPNTELWQSTVLPDFTLCVGLITRPEDKNIGRQYREYVGLV